MNEIENRIIKLIDDNKEAILAFGNDIYNHAELGYKEFRTSEKFVEFLKSLNITVQTDLAITGAKGYINQQKKDNISLALIGELDALRIPRQSHANQETQAAHCCGHHAQLTGVIGAALALSDPEVAEVLDGQVVFFAVPAEEYGEIEFKNTLIEEGKIKYGGGKCELIRIGAFDDIDLSLAHHSVPGVDKVTIGGKTSNGFVSKVIRYKGKAAHAAGAPDEGINALSAATLGLEALALNRDTFKDEDCIRVHPILTKGGNIVNVVPDEAVVETLVRGRSLEAFTDASNKTDRAFKAGALAFGAGIRIETMPGNLPALKQTVPDEVKDIIRELLPDKTVAEMPDSVHGAVSSDLGDLEHLQPVVSFLTGGIGGGLHQADFEIIDEEEAYITTAKIFALSAYRLLRNGAAAAKKLVDDYQPRFKNKEEYIEFVEQFNKVEENDIYQQL